MARSFLSDPVRRAVANLQGLAPPSGMLVSINPERLLVQVDRNLAQQPESLLNAVHEALLIHDGLQYGVTSQLGQGIEIVASNGGAPEECGPPVCKVCGELIESPAVLCSVCRTPHHRDCWEFVGACSIYGCTGKTCVPA